jgi:hypothetical protein
MLAQTVECAFYRMTRDARPIVTPDHTERELL